MLRGGSLLGGAYRGAYRGDGDGVRRLEDGACKARVPIRHTSAQELDGDAGTGVWRSGEPSQLRAYLGEGDGVLVGYEGVEAVSSHSSNGGRSGSSSRGECAEALSDPVSSQKPLSGRSGDWSAARSSSTLPSDDAQQLSQSLDKSLDSTSLISDAVGVLSRSESRSTFQLLGSDVERLFDVRGNSSAKWMKVLSTEGSQHEGLCIDGSARACGKTM